MTGPTRCSRRTRSSTLHEEEIRKGHVPLVYEEYMLGVISRSLAERADRGDITPDQLIGAFNAAWPEMLNQMRAVPRDGDGHRSWSAVCSSERPGAAPLPHDRRPRARRGRRAARDAWPRGTRAKCRTPVAGDRAQPPQRQG